MKMHKEKESYLRKINQIMYEIENKRMEEAFRDQQGQSDTFKNKA